MKFFMKFLIRSLSVLLVFSALNSCKFGGISSSYGDEPSREDPSVPLPPEKTAKTALDEFMASLHFVDVLGNTVDLSDFKKAIIWAQGTNQNDVSSFSIEANDISFSQYFDSNLPDKLQTKIFRPDRGNGNAVFNFIVQVSLEKDGVTARAKKTIPVIILEKDMTDAEKEAKLKEEFDDIKIVEFENGGPFTPLDVHSNFILPKTGKNGTPIKWNIIHRFDSLRNRGDGVCEVLGYDEHGYSTPRNSPYAKVILDVSFVGVYSGFYAHKHKQIVIHVTKKTEAQKRRDEVQDALEDTENLLSRANPGIDLNKIDKDFILPKQGILGTNLKWEAIGSLSRILQLDGGSASVNFFAVSSVQQSDYTLRVTVIKGNESHYKNVKVGFVNKLFKKSEYPEFAKNAELVRKTAEDYELTYFDGKEVWPCLDKEFMMYVVKDLSLPVSFLDGIKVSWTQNSYVGMGIIPGAFIDIYPGKGVVRRPDAEDQKVGLKATFTLGEGVSKAFKNAKEFKFYIPKKDQAQPSTTEIDDKIENNEILKSVVNYLDKLEENESSSQDDIDLLDDVFVQMDHLFENKFFRMQQVKNCKDLYPRTKGLVDSGIDFLKRPSASSKEDLEHQRYGLVLFYSHYQDVYEKKHGKKSPDFDAEIYHKYDYRKNEFP